MKAFSGPNASVYSNFGYGFGVNQPTTPITATMQNIQNSSHEMLSSGFISGQMTSGSASVSTFNNYCGTQQIDVLKKRPFEDLIDESSDDNEYAQDFENEAMAEAPSSLAYSNSWCSSELRSKCRENSFKLSFDISDSKCLNLDLGSDVSDLSDCENIIEHSEFNPDRASTPNNDQNGNEESNPTSDMQYDNEPGAEWPTKDDNEVRTNNKLILSHKIYINISHSCSANTARNKANIRWWSSRIR